jgi:glucosyl-3-phosphoglycerate synthase
MTLSPPSPNLRVCVVVPARDEESLVGCCLRALAAQESVSHEEYEILLVLDACTDGTEARAREVAAAHPSLRLHLLDGPGEGSGHARRIGMETACARLLGLGLPDGLIASTDADTVVEPDWLAAQLAATERGARAIGGRIDLANDGSLPQALLDWHAERGLLRHLKLLSEPGHSGETEHWQFSGASLALTAAVYREVGGLEPRAALEDEHLEQVLHQRGIPIERLLSVRVTTSARLVGRARQGLAHDLAAAKLRTESQELPDQSSKSAGKALPADSRSE